MKKGFTLIELLAVIVILAIIALIATPIVLNIINDTKESAGLRSAEMYLNAVEQTIARNNMSGTFNPVSCNINENGNLECDGDTEEVIVEVDGEKPVGGSISFEDGKINKVSLSFNNDKLIVKDENGKLVYGDTEEKICKAIAPIEQVIQGDCLSCKETKVVGVQATAEAPYAQGAVYSCDLGDGPRTFYVLENDTTNKQVSLIMNENLGDEVSWTLWESHGGEWPFPANAELEERTSGWTKLTAIGGSVSLPSNDMLSGVLSQDLLRTNLLSWTQGYQDGYWTSTPYHYEEEGTEYQFAYLYYTGGFARCGVDIDADLDSTAVCGESGLRPVITISIDQL